MADTTHVHKFEIAGLGQAPFQFIGMTESRGPIRHANPDGTVTEIGAPGQPMGTCAYCGQGIAYLCAIRSADGRTFVVGSDCVLKVGDKGLVNTVKREVNRTKRAKQVARETARIDTAVSVFEITRSRFEALPHPRGFTDRSTGAPLTLADQVDWMLANSGHSGKLRTARLIERTMKNPPIVVDEGRDDLDHENRDALLGFTD